MPEQHSILGGKVHLYQRPNSSFWQCSTYLAGKNRRISTKEESLSRAKEIAEDWYLQLRGKLRNGEIKTEKMFRDASEQYLREYEIITQGQRNKEYVDTASTGDHACIWCRSSEIWAFRKSSPAKSRNIAFTGIRKQSLNMASRRRTTPCIRKL